MKGKKFDAAEKHFREKELKYKREINHLHEAFNKATDANLQLLRENEKLKKETLDMKLRYEKLLACSKLSEADIRNALDGDKTIVQLSGILEVLTKHF